MCGFAVFSSKPSVVVTARKQGTDPNFCAAAVGNRNSSVDPGRPKELRRSQEVSVAKGVPTLAKKKNKNKKNKKKRKQNKKQKK